MWMRIGTWSHLSTENQANKENQIRVLRFAERFANKSMWQIYIYCFVHTKETKHQFTSRIVIVINNCYQPFQGWLVMNRKVAERVPFQRFRFRQTTDSCWIKRTCSINKVKLLTCFQLVWFTCVPCSEWLARSIFI